MLAGLIYQLQQFGRQLLDAFGQNLGGIRSGLNLLTKLLILINIICYIHDYAKRPRTIENHIATHEALRLLINLSTSSSTKSFDTSSFSVREEIGNE